VHLSTDVKNKLVRAIKSPRMTASRMYLILLLLGFILIMAFLWWLSGYDSAVTGNDRHADFVRRLIRCGITVPLLLLVLITRGFFLFLLATPIAIIWASCIAELFSRAFLGLTDPQYDRDFDPRANDRELARLSALVQNGWHDEAIALCKRLQADGDANVLAMDAMLFQLYQAILEGQRAPASPPLAEAHALCGEQRFAEAEVKLNALLKREPANVGALLMLVRIYSRGLRSPAKARAVLEYFARQPHVPASFLKEARRLIDEWSGIVPPSEHAGKGIESMLAAPRHPPALDLPASPRQASVEELLASGHLLTAIEILEGQVRVTPADFELWMKLARAHGVNCANAKEAGKIVARMEANRQFTPEQIRDAKAKLREWR
jgi:hypothetical protein